jgi:hypothetical protein
MLQVQGVINLTYDTWDPDTGEGILGFIGAQPEMFGIGISATNSSGSDAVLYAGFN